MQARGSTLSLKPWEGITSSKQGYHSLPQQKRTCVLKNIILISLKLTEITRPFSEENGHDLKTL